MFRLFTYIIILHSIILSDVNRQVLKSDSEELIIEYNINAETESDLYPISLLVGLPTQDFPAVSISFENPSAIPFHSQQETTPLSSVHFPTVKSFKDDGIKY